jgi:hypothetical protein
MNKGVWLVVLGLAVLGAPAIAAADETHKVSIVNTSPKYGETIQSLKGLVVEIVFSKPMDPATQHDVSMDQRGAVDEKGEPIEFDGTYTWVNPTTLRFAPKGTLKPDSVYQVTVWSAKAKDGSALDGVPYRLPFSTSGAK